MMTPKEEAGSAKDSANKSPSTKATDAPSSAAIATVPPSVQITKAAITKAPSVAAAVASVKKEATESDTAKPKEAKDKALTTTKSTKATTTKSTTSATNNTTTNNTDTTTTSVTIPADGRKRKRSWEESYQALKKFKEKTGHCQVPVHNYQEDLRLGGWVNQQRARRTKLSQPQKDKLNAIGFQWTVKARNKHWKEMLLKLQKFQSKYGHTHLLPPSAAAQNAKNAAHSSFLYPSKYAKLAAFCQDQRLSQRNKKLSASRQQELDDLGFCWDRDEAQAQAWQCYYQQLVDFFETYGHMLVPLVKKGKRNVLGHWLAQQRRTFRQQQQQQSQKDSTEGDTTTSKGLTPEQIQMLNKLDAGWAEAVSDDEEEDDDALEDDSDSADELDLELAPAENDQDMVAAAASSDATVSEDEHNNDKPKPTVPKKPALSKAAVPVKRKLSLPTTTTTSNDKSKDNKKDANKDTRDDKPKKKAKKKKPTVDKKKESSHSKKQPKKSKDQAFHLLAPLAVKLCRLLAKEHGDGEGGAAAADDKHMMQHHATKAYEQRIEAMIQDTETRLRHHRQHHHHNSSSNNGNNNGNKNTNNGNGQKSGQSDSHGDGKPRIKLEP